MRRVPVAGTIVAIVVALVIVLLRYELSDYHLGLAARVGVYFIAILGLNILTGYTGQISIGHGAFMAIGGYTTAIMSADHHLNLIATLPLAFAITFVCGLLVGIPALRLSGVYLALATFALAVSVPQFPLKFSKFTGGSNGIRTVTTPTNSWLYWVTWASAGIGFVARLADPPRPDRPRLPRRPRQRARRRVVGRVSLPIYKTLAFGISAAYAGVAGSLFVLVTNGFAQPNEFGVLLSLQLLIGAAVAGLGSLWGVLAGAAFIGLLPEISASAPLVGSSHGQDVVFGLILIVIMLVLPNGAVGVLGQLRQARRARPSAATGR